MNVQKKAQKFGKLEKMMYFCGDFTKVKQKQ